MREIFSLCFDKVLGAFAIWMPVLLGSALLPSALVVWWSRRRLRRWSAGRDRAPSRTLRWAVWALLFSVQLVGLPLVAFITGIPFCLERGVAAAFESTSPRLVDWAIRTGVDNLRNRLQVEDDRTLVDLGALEDFLDDVRPITLRARGLLGTASALPELAANQYFVALRTVLDELVNTNPNLTWRELSTATHAQAASAWQRQARTIGGMIRAASLRHVSFLVPTVLAANALTVLLIGLVIRPKTAPAAPSSLG
jgi:hypothetical protein